MNTDSATLVVVMLGMLSIGLWLLIEMIKLYVDPVYRHYLRVERKLK